MMWRANEVDVSGGQIKPALPGTGRSSAPTGRATARWRRTGRTATPTPRHEDPPETAEIITGMHLIIGARGLNVLKCDEGHFAQYLQRAYPAPAAAGPVKMLTARNCSRLYAGWPTLTADAPRATASIALPLAAIE